MTETSDEGPSTVAPSSTSEGGGTNASSSGAPRAEQQQGGGGGSSSAHAGSCNPLLPAPSSSAIGSAPPPSPVVLQPAPSSTQKREAAVAGTSGSGGSGPTTATASSSSTSSMLPPSSSRTLLPIVSMVAVPPSVAIEAQVHASIKGGTTTSENSFPLSACAATSSSSAVLDLTPKVFKNRKLRSGKWFKEEEEYADALRDLFERGVATDCVSGCTLRAYLSKKLHCAPMRISKKYAGKGIGKTVFLSKLGLETSISKEDKRVLEEQIKEKEERFHTAALSYNEFGSQLGFIFNSGEITAPSAQAIMNNPLYTLQLGTTAAAPVLLTATNPPHPLVGMTGSSSAAHVVSSVPQLMTHPLLRPSATATASHQVVQMQAPPPTIAAMHQQQQQQQRAPHAAATILPSSMSLHPTLQSHAPSVPVNDPSFSLRQSFLRALQQQQQQEPPSLPGTGDGNNPSFQSMGGGPAPLSLSSEARTAPPPSALPHPTLYLQAAAAASGQARTGLLVNNPLLKDLASAHGPDFLSGFDRVAFGLKPAAPVAGSGTSSGAAAATSSSFVRTRSFEDFHRFLGQEFASPDSPEARRRGSGSAPTVLDYGMMMNGNSSKGRAVAAKSNNEALGHTNSGTSTSRLPPDAKQSLASNTVPDINAVFSAESYAMFATAALAASSQHAAYSPPPGAMFGTTHNGLMDRPDTFDLERTMHLVSAHVGGLQQQQQQARQSSPSASHETGFPDTSGRERTRTYHCSSVTLPPQTGESLLERMYGARGLHSNNHLVSASEPSSTSATETEESGQGSNQSSSASSGNASSNESEDVHTDTSSTGSDNSDTSDSEPDSPPRSKRAKTASTTATTTTSNSLRGRIKHGVKH